MKKKIKDFTLEEIRNNCRKYKNCQGCPFWLIGCFKSIFDIINGNLEKEIEVDESNNIKH